MKKPRKIKIEEEDEQEDGHALLGVDTGSGRWFVFDMTGTASSRLVAGPYQTEAAAQRLVDSYDPPPEVEIVILVRCEGTWQDAVPHIEDALAKWREAMREPAP
jgi:hypothetical protein